MTTTFDLLVAHPFLTGLPPHHLARLARWAHRAPFRAGARLFEENGRADRYWLIRDGYVNLDIRVPGRSDVVLETIGPGTVLGWSWLFPPYRWHFGAVAAGPLLSIAVDGPATRAMCDADPEFGYELTKRFMAVVVDRMQATRIRLLDLYRAPA
ncbi:cyclic nucleotide-binding domain-containing protein [Dactylosporangium fulvum]|uniref:Cyclic nucleotide-binding domain-containing protein n=1 Tax=Dactylosporangium fulvum TaxID=53359 RepID=A0ABY5VUX6_9ACTN|nr:cyclic nucleotide-binding domain-containing protein [Dactylosporangium fulvum]UWP79586.1 cyclic nucleotide-binding domain-containing protein [Dactylosporangium fulvum]